MDKTLQTVTGYNRCATRFAAQHFDLGVYETYVREFAALLPPDARILDLGCGPGNIAHYLGHNHPARRITGVDLAAQMLSLARRNVPRARFIRKDLRSLKLSQQFDALILSFCIIHLDDRETAALLQKSVNWLIPGGYLYLNFMTGGTSGFAKPSFSEAELYFNYYFPEQLLTPLTKNGYRIVSRKDCPQPGSQSNRIRDVFIIAQKTQKIHDQKKRETGAHLNVHACATGQAKIITSFFIIIFSGFAGRKQPPRLLPIRHPSSFQSRPTGGRFRQLDFFNPAPPAN